MRKLLNAMRKGQRGFTLIEMLAVTAILATVTAVVFPAVTGTNTEARQSAQTVDINAVQTGIDRWEQDFGDFPTFGEGNSPFTTWVAGQKPTGTATGAGTANDPFSFTEKMLAAINFADSDTGVVFEDDILRNKPSHADDAAVASDLAANVVLIKRGGADVYIKFAGSGATTMPIWGMDIDARPWVFISSNEY